MSHAYGDVMLKNRFTSEEESWIITDNYSEENHIKGTHDQNGMYLDSYSGWIDAPLQM